MRAEIRETIQQAAAQHGATFESITAFLRDTRKMACFESPCTGCLDSAPPYCRNACPSLNTFQAVTHLQDTHLSPSTTVETVFGSITIPVRRSSILANLGSPNSTAKAEAKTTDLEKDPKANAWVILVKDGQKVGGGEVI